MNTNISIKICGMSRQEDITAAAMLGVDVCGFIFAPQSPRYVTPEHVASLDTDTMLRVGVFTTPKIEEIHAIVERAKLHVIQLHGKQDINLVQALQTLYGVEKLIYVLWPDSYKTLQEFNDEIQRFAPHACTFLLDAGLSGGGSGQGINTQLLRHFATQFSSKQKWFLAGGLSHLNIKEILTQYTPTCLDCNFGLDFNSGLEDAPAQKNKEHMRTAIEAVRNYTANSLRSKSKKERP